MTGQAAYNYRASNRSRNSRNCREPAQIQPERRGDGGGTADTAAAGTGKAEPATEIRRNRANRTDAARTYMAFPSSFTAWTMRTAKPSPILPTARRKNSAARSSSSAASTTAKSPSPPKSPKTSTRRGIHAGNLVREVAKIAGGGGGGRPDFAQAGGRDPGKLQDALDAVPRLIESQLK